MLWNSELAKSSFVSQHDDGHKCVLTAKDLCQLFCLGDLDSK